MGSLIDTVLSSLRKDAFQGKLNGTIMSKMLSVEVLGRLALRFSIFTKKLSLCLGYFSQRAVEYPWVLAQIKSIKSGSLIIDVGFAESLLSHELTCKGFRVIGLDIKACPFKNKRVYFIKRNIMDTRLPDGTFDAAIMVSTVEHIGLSIYEQLELEDHGDIKTMAELHRILKPNGILIMSTPYIGDNPFRLYSFERNYNRERLTKLLQQFQIIKENYFFPEKIKQGGYWKKMCCKEIDKQSFTTPGIACLVLRKSPN